MVRELSKPIELSLMSFKCNEAYLKVPSLIRVSMYKVGHCVRSFLKVKTQATIYQNGFILRRQLRASKTIHNKTLESVF